MQTIGIMSMQRIFNYGSTLQAHSLKRLIQTVRPTASINFVDFRPGDPLLDEAQTRVEPRAKLLRAIHKVREYSDVNTSIFNKVRFFNHKRSYASKYLSILGMNSAANHDLRLDVQVIGSDEVFNCVQSNPNVGYAPDLFARDSVAARIISYAASFGNTTVSKIREANIEQDLATDFGRFSAISVRDRNSALVVESLTGSRPEVHLDPTLVHDLMTSESQIPKGRQHADKYLIIYGYSGRITEEENAAVRAYADKNELTVLAFGGLQSSADKFVDCDPFTLLAYFRDAEAVVSDTFHGTIFSIINEVPFAAIVRRSSSYGYGNEEKLTYLLESLHLKDRALQRLSDLEELLNTTVNYDAVREVRERERVRTLNYLDRALSRSTSPADS